MTQPYYTAVPTVGPADPNAPTRGKFYAVLAVLFPAIGALATFGILSADQASAITGFATAALGLAGAFGFGVAAKNTNKQVKNGTFDPPPVINAFDALSQLKTQVDATVEHAKTQVNDATAVLQGAAAMIPGGGALVSGVFSGPVGDLIQGMADLDLNSAVSSLRDPQS